MTAEDMPIRSERNEDIKWLEGKDVTKITKKQVSLILFELFYQTKMNLYRSKKTKKLGQRE